MLDLTFLATGYRQHAFVRTGEPDQWVYKIPAAFGYVLPYEHRTRSGGRITSWKKALLRLVVVWPHELKVRVLRPRLARLDAAVPSLARAVSAATRPVLRATRGLRDHILMAHHRRARRRDFERMLDLLEALEAAGLQGFVLPYRIERDVEAKLRVQGREVYYRGPMLLQLRTDAFFSRRALAPFEWQELVEVVHALWRRGFGLTERGEVLGYRSWALRDGHPRLADTSSLSRDSRRVRRTLHPASLDEQERRVLEWLPDAETAGAFQRYFEFLRQKLDRKTLDALWESDGAAGP
jgi:hypothetical protein